MASLFVMFPSEVLAGRENFEHWFFSRLFLSKNPRKKGSQKFLAEEGKFWTI